MRPKSIHNTARSDKHKVQDDAPDVLYLMFNTVNITDQRVCNGHHIVQMTPVCYIDTVDTVVHNYTVHHSMKSFKLYENLN